MADLHIWPFIERIYLLKELVGIEVLSPDACPQLTQYTQRMFQEPCVKATRIDVKKYIEYRNAYSKGVFPDDV